MKTSQKTRAASGLITFVGGLLSGLLLGAWGLLLFGVLFFGNVLIAIVRHRGRKTTGGSAVDAVVGMVGGAVALGACLLLLYLGSYRWTEQHCAEAAIAPEVAQRRAAVERMESYAWLKWLVERLTNKGEFVADCDGVKGELETLARDGTCPRFPPRDEPCRCGELESESVTCSQGEVLVCRSWEPSPLGCRSRDELLR